MSSVVLDNSASAASTLTANSVRVGAGGISSSGPVVASGNDGRGSIFTGALTISDDAPAPPATRNPSSWTTYASQTGGGGLGPNQLQKFAYGDPLVAGPQGIQEYEQGYWVATATAFVAPAVAPDTIFINRPAYQPLPLASGATNMGTFLTTGAAVVVPAAGIGAGCDVRLMLLGGTGAAFTAAAGAGLVAPAITIQVGATTAASTFTAAATPAGWTYAWEILYA